jgi:hypothetical protein
MAMKTINRWTPSRKEVESWKQPRPAKWNPQLVPLGTTAAALEGAPSGLPTTAIRYGLIAEVFISASALIVVEGRGHPSHHWHELARFTASNVQTIPANAEVRAVVKDNTGTVALTLRFPA